MTSPTIDDVAATLAEYEAAAIATGEWNGAEPPEFSADGVEWSPFWLADEPPALARATVRRRGIEAPTVVVVAWRESIPADDAWRALWLAKPMKLFGAYALRAAIRRAFRDAVGDRRDADEPREAAAAWSPRRDWLAEIKQADTPDAVHALHAEIKAAPGRQMTPPLEVALRARLTAVTNPGTAVPAAAPGGGEAVPNVAPQPTEASPAQSSAVGAERPGGRSAPTPATIPHERPAARTRRPRRAQSTGLTQPLADTIRAAVDRHDAKTASREAATS